MSNITTPVLSIVDTAIVGHIGAVVYIGAIAVGGSMLNMLYWLTDFLRMSSSGLTAQAFGAGNRNDCFAVLWRSLSVALVASLSIWLLSVPLCKGLLLFMDADGLTSGLAARYFYIVITGAPAVMGNYALSGWFLGTQDSRTPMWMALITNVVNIVVSLTLVVGFGMKIEGVAIGTPVAQWVGFIYGLVCAVRHYKLPVPKWPEVLRRTDLRRFFAINTDIFLRTACLVAVTLWFTRSGASQGAGILAANAILMQFFLFFSYFMDGFAFAAEALCGKYHGASDRTALHQCIYAIFRWGAAIAIIFAAIYLAGGRTAITLLTDDATVADTASHFIGWAVLMPLTGFAAFVWDGVYTGLTLTRRMMQAMAMAMIIFFAICHLLRPSLGNHGLWTAFLAYLLARGLLQTLFWRLEQNSTYKS